jgi:murein DD-endopeptidase MepM/ murein hydrolase activator NlpD
MLVLAGLLVALLAPPPHEAQATHGMFLPWPPLADAEPGQGQYIVTQGPNNCGSHCTSDPNNRWAYDFGMNDNVQVIAAAHAGTVYETRAGGNRGGFCDPADDIYANYVILRHNIETNKSTLYLHLSYNSVSVLSGWFVYPGRPLGRSGNTGYTCGGANDGTAGHHLHFALRDGLAYISTTVEVWFDDASVAGSNGRPPQGTGPYASSNRMRFSSRYNGGSRWLTLSPGVTSSEVGQWVNTGWDKWLLDTSQEARLGTWNPVPGQDQNSALGGAASGGTCTNRTNWYLCNRIRPTTSQVDPDQIGWFSFTIRAPSSSGTYDLYLRPLIEGVKWMQDEGVFWRVTVP